MCVHSHSLFSVRMEKILISLPVLGRVPFCWFFPRNCYNRLDVDRKFGFNMLESDWQNASFWRICKKVKRSAASLADLQKWDDQKNVKQSVPSIRWPSKLASFKKLKKESQQDMLYRNLNTPERKLISLKSSLSTIPSNINK